MVSFIEHNRAFSNIQLQLQCPESESTGPATSVGDYGTGATLVGHTTLSPHRQAASHLGVRVFAVVQARIPEDNAGCGRVVEAAGGRRAGAATGRGGRGRLAEEIGDAPHDVHRLRPRPSRASSSPASPIAEEKNLGDPNRTRDAHSDLRELRGTRSRSRRGDSRGGIGNSVWDRRARATSPMFRARNVGRSVRFVRGEEEV